MALNTVAYALAKKHTDETAVSLGSLVGAPCTIKGITEDADKNQLVEFEWTGTDGTKKTRVMTVPAGVSITGFTKIDDTHFVWNFSDGTTSASIEYPKQQIPISEETGNAIIEKDDGLYVSTTGVEISAESNNAIQTKTDGLYVDVPVKSVSLDGTEITPDATGNIDISISNDTDNLITVESDGLKVTHDDDKVDVDQAIENAGKALIVGVDGKVTIGDAGVKVSAKTGNDIETITDVGEEGIYVSVPVKSVSVGTNELTPDTDGKVTIPVSADTDNLITYETDGLKVGHDADKVDVDQTVANAGKALIVGEDGMVTVGDAGVKVSSKEGNTIQEITDPGEEGIFVPEGLKVSPKEGNIIQTITDVGEEGIYAVKGAVEVSQEANNMLDSKTDGLFVDGSTWRDLQEYTNDEIDALFTGTPETVEAYANLIKDDITSELSLWSSKKVSDKIDAIIDDENSSEKSAYSSSKVNDLLDNINPSWSGTKAEFEALDKSTLKDGQTVNITDDYESSDLATVEYVDDKVLKNYTTDEKVVGTFLGKPLYEKTVSIATISTDFQNPSAIASNVAELVNAHGSVNFTSWGNTTRTAIPLSLATSAAGGYIAPVIYNGKLGLFYSVSGASWTFKDAIITVQYTKTTD